MSSAMRPGKYSTSLEHQIWFTVVTVVVWLLTGFFLHSFYLGNFLEIHNVVKHGAPMDLIFIEW